MKHSLSKTNCSYLWSTKRDYLTFELAAELAVSLDIILQFSYKSIVMMRRKTKEFLWGLSLLLLFAQVCCISTEERFKKGKELESQGRFEEAARNYIKVLKKDPTWEEAQQRLENVGAQAIDILLGQAYDYKSAAAYEDAIQALNRIDDLRSRTEKIGVILQVPENYDEFRTEMTAAAITSLFEQAEYSKQRGDWAEALRKLERLKRHYHLSPAQNQRISQSQAIVYIKWAEQDLSRNHFRAAFEHAQKAIDILGSRSDSGINALEIQKAALNAGTRVIAILPFWVSGRVTTEIPQRMVRELYDVLLYEYLSEPIPFVVLTDTGQIHREIRHRHLRNTAITRRMAARVGQNLNTDFVVIGKIESYFEDEKKLKEKEHRARLRHDKSTSTTYLEQEYTLKMTTEVKYQIIDSRTHRMIDEKTINAKVSDKFKRGVFDGDYNTLVLSRSERRLFNREKLQQKEQKLVDRLIDELADRLADNILNRILRLIR